MRTRSCSSASLLHLLRLRQRQRRRLLAQHVHAGAQRRQRRGVVELVRDADADRVQLRAREHRLDGVEGLRVDGVLGREGDRPRLVDVRDGGDADVAVGEQRVGRAAWSARLVAAAEDADLERSVVLLVLHFEAPSREPQGRREIARASPSDPGGGIAAGASSG